MGWVGSHKMDPWTTLDFNRGKEGHERQGRKTTRRVRRDHRPPPATVPQPEPLAYEWQFSDVNTSPPVAVAQYCDERVCLSVCLSVCLFLELHVRPIFTNFCACYFGRGSVLLWRRCGMLCTSGFTHDANFAHNVPAYIQRYEKAQYVDI